MGLKYLPLIFSLSFCLHGAECPSGFVNIGENCYKKNHIDVLQDFVELNPSLSGLQPQNIGYQEWTNNQLTYLYLGNNNIVSIPDSIGLLKSLLGLDLRENNIQSLPDGICDIYPFYTELNLFGNQICPKYPYCFNYIGDQDIKECENFSCPHQYTKINGECYSEEHIQMLQSIININPMLEGLLPLDLGEEVGRIGWENGNLIHLNLVGNGLTHLPESLCFIYNKLDYFDVSNNSICSPYPDCFEFIGLQNTTNCNPSNFRKSIELNDIYIDNREIIINNELPSINFELFKQDIAVLEAFISNNNSLIGRNPLQVGIQKWNNMRLTSLDLSNLGITYVPAKLCDVYSNLTLFDISGNEICPPFPNCIDYIGKQNTDLCGNYLCPDNYTEIDENCYNKKHLLFLEALIDSNTSLSEAIPRTNPLEIGSIGGFQNWHNGKIDKLILTGEGLNKIPESICNIYENISVFDVSNNSICPPYPSCIEKVGYQNLDNCDISVQSKRTCLEEHVSLDGRCYSNNDLQALVDIIQVNLHLEDFHPLLLGYQLWKNGRLIQLNLDDWQIISIPRSINNLDQLEYLNLSNNQLSSLPETFCYLSSHLNNLQITNNLLCPPYLDCFDFMGDQNTENCEHHYCPYRYIEIQGKCYSKEDIDVLQDFIDNNVSLNNRNPLEIGLQKWQNMRLNYLYLGVNEINIIPESICTIISNLATLNISQNNVCPPYPDCVSTLIGEQNTSSCP